LTPCWFLLLFPFSFGGQFFFDFFTSDRASILKIFTLIPEKVQFLLPVPANAV